MIADTPSAPFRGFLNRFLQKARSTTAHKRVATPGQLQLPFPAPHAPPAPPLPDNHPSLRPNQDYFVRRFADPDFAEPSFMPDPEYDEPAG